MAKTSQALENLRAVVILLVLAFHSFASYIVAQPSSPPAFAVAPYAWRTFPIIDADRWIGFDLFCAFQFLYLMQLMFFLSGLFVWPSLLRRGPKQFLAHRLLRLGVPCALGIYLLMPIAFYPVYRVTASDPGWSAFWSRWEALPITPGGPLWFLWFLLVLNVAATAVYLPFSNSPKLTEAILTAAFSNNRKLVPVFFVISAAAYFPMAAIFLPWQWIAVGPLEFQPSLAPQYVIYFFAGVAVGAYGLERGPLAADGALVRQWLYWALGALASFLLWVIPTAMMVKGPGPSASLQFSADTGFVAFSAAASFGMIALLLRFGSVPWPAFNLISTHAYGIYFFHYPFLLWIQYFLRAIEFPAIGKGALALGLALATSLAASVVFSALALKLWLAVKGTRYFALR